ncbi:MAG: glycosyltransferase family 39 protein [Rhodospirillales bacterium]|nr:glycosyltransferase family 39 protein [Rhodospirillales bacterium]
MPPASPRFWKVIDPARRRLVAALSRLADPSDGRLWDRLAFVLFAVLAGLVALTFRDYGITTDEYVQQVYGEKLWAFYLSGFADRSAFDFENLYLYGGLFDMVAVALQHILPFETYDTRHLLCGLVGVLGIVGIRQLARQIGGPRVGFIAAAMLALTASWYGAMFNNTKDIPFAVGMTWLLYLTCLIVDRLPRPHVSHVVLFRNRRRIDPWAEIRRRACAGLPRRGRVRLYRSYRALVRMEKGQKRRRRRLFRTTASYSDRLPPDGVLLAMVGSRAA